MVKVCDLEAIYDSIQKIGFYTKIYQFFHELHELFKIIKVYNLEDIYNFTWYRQCQTINRRHGFKNQYSKKIEKGSGSRLFGQIRIRTMVGLMMS